MTPAQELTIHFPISLAAAEEALKEAKGNMPIAVFAIKIFFDLQSDWSIADTAKKLIELAEQYNKG